jgi:hypothetical protein
LHVLKVWTKECESINAHARPLVLIKKKLI